MSPNGNEDREYQNLVYQTYLTHKMKLSDNEIASARELDKSLLGLATGALALSMTFIHEIAPNPSPGSFGWVQAAWILFALSILFTLVSFVTSRIAFRRASSNWDKYYEDYRQQGEKAEIPTKNWAAKGTEALTGASFLSFFLGVISFIVFAFKNCPIKE